MSVYSASTGLPGRLWLNYTVGQCRFVNLIQAAFSVEAATEPPPTSRIGIGANRRQGKWWGQCNMHTDR